MCILQNYRHHIKLTCDVKIINSPRVRYELTDENYKITIIWYIIPSAYLAQIVQIVMWFWNENHKCYLGYKHSAFLHSHFALFTFNFSEMTIKIYSLPHLTLNPFSGVSRSETRCSSPGPRPGIPASSKSKKKKSQVPGPGPTMDRTSRTTAPSVELARVV